MMSIRSLIVVVTLCAGAACSRDIVCTANPKWALIVSVLDSTTALSALKGATIVARTGTYVDSIAAAADLGSVFLGVDQSGTYSLSVTKTGYKPWVRLGIVVGTNECGTVAQRITVLLPLAPS